MNSAIRPLMAVMVSMMVSGAAAATQKLDQAIDHVIGAYGGNKLEQLQTLTINERYTTTMVGQSETPDIVNSRQLTREAIVDFKRDRAQVTFSLKQREIDFYLRRIFTDGQAYDVNLVDKMYAPMTNAGRDQVLGNTLTLNDLGLARLLVEHRNTAKLLPDSTIQTRPHHTIAVALPSTGDITLFIDKHTGLISQMERQHPARGPVRTVFSDHVAELPFRYARNAELYVDNQLTIVVNHRKLVMNDKLPSDFASLAGFKARGKALYPAEMTVRPISENVFLVGKGAVHSIFVVDGDNVVGAESYAGVMTRFAALEKHLGRQLTLTDLVVTHHHSDHISGINELVPTTANLVTVDEHTDELLKNITEEFDEKRLVRVEQSRLLLDGKVQVFDIATAHSSHNLVFYVPDEKLLFAADYFRSSYEDEQIIGFRDLANFRRGIDKLGVKIERFASAHGIRLLSYQQLADATEQYRPFQCQSYPAICSALALAAHAH